MKTIGVLGGLGESLNESITKAMAGRNDAESTVVAEQAVAALRTRGVDGIVLACTEIPLLLGQKAIGPDMVNPARLLAEAAVKHAALADG